MRASSAVVAPEPRPARTRAVRALGVCVLLVAVVACSSSSTAFPPTTKATTVPGPPPPAAVVRSILPPGAVAPLVATYFFYWYDAATKLHLRPQDGLPTHLPAQPSPSWHSTAWYRQQLLDMDAAGVNVALPVFWGVSPGQPWSGGGIPYLVAARDQLVKSGRPAPLIGMFYDTTIVRGLDLTRASGIDTFYSNISKFFHLVPQRDWARLHGSPIVWLFLPQDNRFDQRVFDAVYSRFQKEFGVRPYIVRATGWDCATTVSDCTRPIKTDANYVWGTAQDGVQITPLVASVGPGYDERQIAGRQGTYVPRAGGAYYRKDLGIALASGRPILAIETWNEIHEASGIGETVEYGRTYIDITRTMLDAVRKP